MSLASKLPWTHRFAGGYPGLSSQPLPTDADAIDYLSRMATADGAGVETGVAVAVDAFVADSKALGVWDSIRSSCVLAGARTLAGALVPLKNEGPELWDAPTPTIATASGASPGSWDAASQTMSCTLGTTANYPRFGFDLGLGVGSQYVVSGRLTGDTASVTTARLCIAVCGAPATISYNPSTGLLSGTVTAGGTSPALELGLDATLGAASVTIESLSIREVIAAPTNVADGFVEGDYSRTSGLTGDGTSYIDSGRANDDDPQDDKHNAAFLTSISGVSAAFGSGVTVAANYDYMDFFQGTRVASRSASNQTGITPVAGMQSISRDNGANFQYRCSGESGTVAQVSDTPDSQNVLLLARNSDPVSSIAAHTIAFYSIGTSVDLEDLDTAVSNLITAIGEAL